jgi:hypothetical protein
MKKYVKNDPGLVRDIVQGVDLVRLGRTVTALECAVYHDAESIVQDNITQSNAVKVKAKIKAKAEAEVKPVSKAIVLVRIIPNELSGAAGDEEKEYAFTATIMLPTAFHNTVTKYDVNYPPTPWLHVLEAQLNHFMAAVFVVPGVPVANCRAIIEDLLCAIGDTHNGKTTLVCGRCPVDEDDCRFDEDKHKYCFDYVVDHYIDKHTSKENR